MGEAMQSRAGGGWNAVNHTHAHKDDGGDAHAGAGQGLGVVGGLGGGVDQV